MEEPLVSRKLAGLAQARGFDELCEYVYQHGIQGEPMRLVGGLRKNSTFKAVITVPTGIQLMRWVREEKGIVISIYNNASGYLWNMAKRDGGSDMGWSHFQGPNEAGVWNTWDEALEAALIKSMYIIDQKK